MHLLLVEDDAALRQALQRALQAMGHGVTAVGTAEEVDAALARDPIELALIDLGLPGEDGLSLIQRLRQADPGLGLIVISARGSPPDRISGYEGGADLYLSKPLLQEELAAAITALSRRLATPAPAGRSAQAPGIELDRRSLEVRGPQGSARLTTTEFTLLAGLNQAQGQVLEIPAIYRMLGREPGQKSALEALVYRVRRKMGQAGAGENAIRAHRLKGYQLFCPVRIV